MTGDIPMFQPMPEHADASYVARQRAIARILAERRAMEN